MTSADFIFLWHIQLSSSVKCLYRYIAHFLKSYSLSLSSWFVRFWSSLVSDSVRKSKKLKSEGKILRVRWRSISLTGLHQCRLKAKMCEQHLSQLPVTCFFLFTWSSAAPETEPEHVYCVGGEGKRSLKSERGVRTVFVLKSPQFFFFLLVIFLP